MYDFHQEPAKFRSDNIQNVRPKAPGLKWRHSAEALTLEDSFRAAVYSFIIIIFITIPCPLAAVMKKCPCLLDK